MKNGKSKLELMFERIRIKEMKTTSKENCKKNDEKITVETGNDEKNDGDENKQMKKEENELLARKNELKMKRIEFPKKIEVPDEKVRKCSRKDEKADEEKKM